MNKCVQNLKENFNTVNPLCLIYFNHKSLIFAHCRYVQNTFSTSNVDMYNHIITYGKFCTYSREHKKSTIFVKKFLYINNDKEAGRALGLFNENPLFWKDRFHEFNKDNYPEYFL